MNRKKIRAVVPTLHATGGLLEVQDVERPALQPGCIRIQVHAAGVNRADLMQSQGYYPPPAGVTSILGLECAGEVTEIASDVTSYQVGDMVMALLPGGGYAEEAVVHAEHVLHIPTCLNMHQAAGFMETYITAYLNLFYIDPDRVTNHVLVHGGTSGVGTSAISLCKWMRRNIFVTVGNANKQKKAIELGATAAICYRDEKFEERILELTHQQGVDRIVCCVGAPYLEANLKCLSSDGLLMMIAMMQGHEATLSLRTLLKHRHTIRGSTLRNLSHDLKTRIIQSFQEECAQGIQQGAFMPVIDRIFNIGDASKAHEHMKSGQHIGKIVLTFD